MKANHNEQGVTDGLVAVVVNINKSKNESKSQHFGYLPLLNQSCGKYQ